MGSLISNVETLDLFPYILITSSKMLKQNVVDDVRMYILELI